MTSGAARAWRAWRCWSAPPRRRSRRSPRPTAAAAAGMSTRTVTGTGLQRGQPGQGGVQAAVGQHRRVHARGPGSAVRPAPPWPARGPGRRCPGAASGSAANFALARPSSMASDTSRCWAPSCRSRSIRRRSASAASTTLARLVSSSPIRAASPGPAAGPSSHLATIASPAATSRVSGGAASSSTSPGGHARASPAGLFSGTSPGGRRHRAAPVIGGQRDQGEPDRPHRGDHYRLQHAQREPDQRVHDAGSQVVRGQEARLTPAPATSARRQRRGRGCRCPA